MMPKRDFFKKLTDRRGKSSNVTGNVQTQESAQVAIGGSTNVAQEGQPNPVATTSDHQSTPVDTQASDKEERSVGEVSQEIWNQAFDDILRSSEVEESKEIEKLVKAYVRALMVYMNEDQSDNENKESFNKVSETEILKILNDSTKRQAFMNDVLVRGQKRIKTAKKVSGVIGTISDTILGAQPMADTQVATGAVVPASLPWAGACIGLQVRFRTIPSLF